MKGKNLRLLLEIGTGTKPYSFTKKTVTPNGGDSYDYWYEFKGDDGQKFFIEIVIDDFGDALIGQVDFFVVTGDDDFSVHATNAGTKQMFRVMTTVVESVKDAMLKFYKKTGRPVDRMDFNAAGKNKKNSSAKIKLYSAYAKKVFKGAKVDQHGNSASIRIPKKWFK